MITTLDNQSWAKDLFTGNAAFVEVSGVLYIVSNVRQDGSFVILRSDPVPPSPGPGNSFTIVASYTFPVVNTDFDPVVAYDPNTGLLHVVGSRTNATDATLADIVKFTFDTNQYPQPVALPDPVVLVTGTRVRDAYDVCVLNSMSAPWTVVAAVSVDEAISYDPDGINFQAASPGMNLVFFELDETDTIIHINELINSPTRSGNTFSSVSLISPDGVTVELYYESHPKVLTFADQLFIIYQMNRDAFRVWSGAADLPLTNFQGRFTDDRLTVLADGTKRWLSQVYFNQSSHPLGLVGSLLLGYFDTPGPWLFHTVPGSVLGGSIVQATLSLALAGTNVAYLLEPFNSSMSAWPLRIATLDSTLRFTDVPGYYNSEMFTWLRGTRSIIDAGSSWAVVGERVQGILPSPLPVYSSLFNVPPVVSMTPALNSGTVPTSAIVYRGASGYDLGSGLVPGDLRFDASATADADQDTLIFNWTESSPDLANVTLTPSGAQATLNVARAFGGATGAFRVGVAVNDPTHPPNNVTNIEVDAFNTVTVTVDNNYASGEKVMLYSIVGTGTTDFDDLVLTVDVASPTQFTAPLTHAVLASTPVTGFAMVQFQFQECDITVPFNIAPVITALPDQSVARGATVVLDFSARVTGLNQIDDLPSFAWTQTAGTPMSLSGTTSPVLAFQALGTDVHGETLVFHLVVSDGVNPPTSTDVNVIVAAYDFTGMDTHFLTRAVWSGNISQRNDLTQTWGALNVSAMLTDLGMIKRSSVLDGSDRYVIISPTSVLVYGGVNPNLFFLRRLLIPGVTPTRTKIADAVHTEQDYTLVLGENGLLFRYTSAPLINTDNPDVTLDLSLISQFSFNRIFTTPSFADVRIVVLSGPDGVLLMQVRSSTLQVQAFLELSKLSGFLYGSDNVQFVRVNGVESLRQGKVLIGTIAPSMATITKLQILNNAAIFTGANSFEQNVEVEFTGLTEIPDLNGRKLLVTSATSTGFICSVEHADAGTGPDYTETGTATATNAGTTYETLVDLAHGQVIGTWDAAKLRNQFVTTGEILFEPDSTYTGIPPAPIQATPTVQGLTVTIAWTQERPDLVFAYDVEVSTNGGSTYTLLQRINSGAIEKFVTSLAPSQTYFFRIQAFSVDGTSPFSNVETLTL